MMASKAPNIKQFLLFFMLTSSCITAGEHTQQSHLERSHSVILAACISTKLIESRVAQQLLDETKQQRSANLSPGEQQLLEDDIIFYSAFIIKR